MAKKTKSNGLEGNEKRVIEMCERISFCNHVHPENCTAEKQENCQMSKFVRRFGSDYLNNIVAKISV